MIEDGGDARQLLADWRNDLDIMMNSKETAPPAYKKAPAVDLRRISMARTFDNSPERSQSKQQPRDTTALSVTDKVIDIYIQNSHAPAQLVNETIHRLTLPNCSPY